MLPEIGEVGQLKLKAAKVLIVGVGGLGSPIALYLAGAGVGTIGLADDDEVSLSNLQRQILYTEEEVGDLKAICASMRISALNREIKVNACPGRLSKENARDLIGQYDIIVDFYGFKWLIQTTDLSPVGSRIGIKIDPDGFHVMKKSHYSGMFGDYSSYSEEYDEISDAAYDPEEAEGEEAGDEAE